jgi:hypothetical protein
LLFRNGSLAGALPLFRVGRFSEALAVCAANAAINEAPRMVRIVFRIGISICVLCRKSRSGPSASCTWGWLGDPIMREMWIDTIPREWIVRRTICCLRTWPYPRCAPAADASCSTSARSAMPTRSYRQKSKRSAQHRPIARRPRDRTVAEARMKALCKIFPMAISARCVRRTVSHRQMFHRHDSVQNGLPLAAILLQTHRSTAGIHSPYLVVEVIPAP